VRRVREHECPQLGTEHAELVEVAFALAVGGRDGIREEFDGKGGRGRCNGLGGATKVGVSIAVPQIEER
jgi:hypothetical protein